MFTFTRLFPVHCSFRFFFPISSSLDILIILLANEGKKQSLPNDQIAEATRHGTFFI